MEEIMNRLLVIAVFALGLLPNLASAVEIKNIRPCFMAFGATRVEAKCLPGDLLFLTYDIENLTLKDGKASYITILELIDDKGKSIFKKETENNVVPQLGGNRMPGDLHVIMAAGQAAGRYSIKLTVHDTIAKDAKAFSYPFDVLPPRFGFVGVSAPAVGFPGQHYVVGFALVNLGLDGKKAPDAEVNIRIYDEKDSKKAISDVKMLLPRDMPENTDLKEANFVPLTFPIYLNRAGRYTVEILAHDKLGNARAELRYPLTVVDVASFTK